MCNTKSLNSMEVEIVVRWMEYHWTAEDRHKFAREFPQIYTKITGARVVVDTDGDLNAILPRKYPNRHSFTCSETSSRDFQPSAMDDRVENEEPCPTDEERELPE